MGNDSPELRVIYTEAREEEKTTMPTGIEGLLISKGIVNLNHALKNGKESWNARTSTQDISGETFGAVMSALEDDPFSRERHRRLANDLRGFGYSDNPVTRRMFGTKEERIFEAPGESIRGLVLSLFEGKDSQYIWEMVDGNVLSIRQGENRNGKPWETEVICIYPSKDKSYPGPQRIRTMEGMGLDEVLGKGWLFARFGILPEDIKGYDADTIYLRDGVYTPELHSIGVEHPKGLSGKEIKVGHADLKKLIDPDVQGISPEKMKRQIREKTQPGIRLFPLVHSEEESTAGTSSLVSSYK